MTDSPRMSLAQRLFGRLLSTATMQNLESQTRDWLVTCTACGNQRDLWELGGIRGGASGTKTTWGRCPVCARNRRLRIARRPAPPGA